MGFTPPPHRNFLGCRIADDVGFILVHGKPREIGSAFER
jgi:hypothetical protein